MEEYVITNCVRCNPVITINILKSMGVRYATISERTPNRPLQKPESAGYTEIYETEIEEYAKKGYRIFYKTASLGGRSRVYRSLEPEKPNTVEKH
jgi:hypothetical protein